MGLWAITPPRGSASLAWAIILPARRLRWVSPVAASLTLQCVKSGTTPRSMSRFISGHSQVAPEL
jgi:hypothetical protein